jgi:hypothetical protein
MSNNNNGAAIPIELMQQLNYFFRRFRVKVPSELVRQNDCRLTHERTSYRHALLFPAGKLMGKVTQSIAESHAV